MQHDVERKIEGGGSLEQHPLKVGLTAIDDSDYL